MMWATFSSSGRTPCVALELGLSNGPVKKVAFFSGQNFGFTYYTRSIYRTIERWRANSIRLVIAVIPRPRCRVYVNNPFPKFVPLSGRYFFRKFFSKSGKISKSKVRPISSKQLLLILRTFRGHFFLEKPTPRIEYGKKTGIREIIRGHGLECFPVFSRIFTRRTYRLEAGTPGNVSISSYLRFTRFFCLGVLEENRPKIFRRF
jgi:hypothetical protein